MELSICDLPLHPERAVAAKGEAFFVQIEENIKGRRPGNFNGESEEMARAGQGAVHTLCF
jgi:hypothetical protein